MPLDINIFLIIAGLGLILLELFLGVAAGFDLVLVGTALIAGGMTGYYLQNFQSGIWVAIVLSTLYILVGRTFVKNRLSIKGDKSNVDLLMKSSAIVTKKISPARPGQVKLDTELWRAESDESFEVGEKVKVEAVKGVTLKVIRIGN